MQITIDTRHDDYATALAVLRRAYGRTAPRGSAPRDTANRGDGVGSDSPPITDDATRKRNKELATDSVTPRRGAKKSSAAKGGSAAPGKRRTSKGAPKAKPAGKQPGRPGAAANVAPPGMSEVIRAWALEQGITVSDRGRLPAHVISAYREANPPPAR